MIPKSSSPVESERILSECQSWMWKVAETAAAKSAANVVASPRFPAASEKRKFGVHFEANRLLIVA